MKQISWCISTPPPITNNSDSNCRKSLYDSYLARLTPKTAASSTTTTTTISPLSHSINPNHSGGAINRNRPVTNQAVYPQCTHTFFPGCPNVQFPINTTSNATTFFPRNLALLNNTTTTTTNNSHNNSDYGNFYYYTTKGAKECPMQHNNKPDPLVEDVLNNIQELENAAPPRPKMSKSDREAIVQRYEAKAKERRIRMYNEAIAIAEELEREEGWRHRTRRCIQFKVFYNTYYGQNVWMVGSVSRLGSWDISKALPMVWTNGNHWVATVVLSTDDGAIEYKFVLKDENTGATIWEPGKNHSLDVRQLPTNSELEDSWGSSK